MIRAVDMSRGWPNHLRVLTTILSLAAVAALARPAYAQSTTCEGLASLTLDNAAIISARIVPEGPAPARGGGAPPPPANMPAHCRVELVLKPSPDSLIHMELWLPPATAWNGKFMGVGNGGFAGSIQGRFSEMPQALRLGYATAGTDTGHQEPGGAWAIGHPEKMIDFAYRATHEMTLKAKEIVRTFYNRGAQYAYFKGCSTGGRMALMEAQRYPDDYDGIIAGSPANRHIHMWTAAIERSISLSRNPDRAITAEQAALVNNLVMTTCDKLGEGFLNNPRACRVDFSVLRCKAGASGNACLTDAQMQTVETFYGGVKNSTGQLVFSGQALGNPITAQQPTNQAPATFFDLVRIAYNDPNVNWQTFDLDRDLKFLDGKIGYVDAVNPDLSKFKASGGKLLITHGWSDPGITPETSIWYYEQVLGRMGRNQSDWVRLFMVPGMGHCAGGPGVNTFDSIGTLEKWVEKGVAPDTMLGTAANGFARPLCPYPQAAEYKGSGDLKDAANWSCKAPGGR